MALELVGCHAVEEALEGAKHRPPPGLRGRLSVHRCFYLAPRTLCFLYLTPGLFSFFTPGPAVPRQLDRCGPRCAYPVAAFLPNPRPPSLAVLPNPPTPFPRREGGEGRPVACS